ncbi:MAG: protein translocase subunit SecF [Gammaproteobacteria bacterium]|nr:protein translocase subunit SecF [Gammaproteobacteria bacterium]MDH5650845.1 protein translocase subunit SecF [Gammaproteobacteria bacterium]
MQFFEKKTHIDFMGKRKIAAIFSVILIVLSIAALATRGLNFGLDFTGGILLEVGYPKAVDLVEVRKVLHDAKYDDAVVQHFGSAKDIIIRLAPREGVSSAEAGDKILKVLSAQSHGEAKMRRQEYVGPQVGGELRDDGGLAMLIALGCILVYVMMRFEWRLAVGSVAALVHDVTITLGFFALFQWDFDLTVMAAVLAVIGYSLNDTIVVFDRIRENFRVIRKGSPSDVVNTSLNQTLSRTLMTSLTTLLVVVAMFFMGGELIHAFSLALIVGIVVGTYSSIYIASNAALALDISRENLLPIEKEGADQENMI